MRNTLLFAAIVLVLGACAPPDPVESSAATESASARSAAEALHVKPSAPVTIRAPRLDEGGATLEIVFGADAADVSVRTYGVDGLDVLGVEEPIRGMAYRRGEAITLEVAFLPGAAGGLLAVRVAGTFSARPMAQSATFSVGRPASESEALDPEAQKAHGAGLHVTRARERGR